MKAEPDTSLVLREHASADPDLVWKLKPANAGFLEARKSRIWEPVTK